MTSARSVALLLLLAALALAHDAMSQAGSLEALLGMSNEKLEKDRSDCVAEISTDTKMDGKKIEMKVFECVLKTHGGITDGKFTPEKVLNYLESEAMIPAANTAKLRSQFEACQPTMDKMTMPKDMELVEKLAACLQDIRKDGSSKTM